MSRKRRNRKHLAVEPLEVRILLTANLARDAGDLESSADAYSIAIERLRQSQQADDDDDVANPYIGPNGLVNRTQAARDREIVARFELESQGVPEDVTEATIAKGKERGGFDDYTAASYVDVVMELIGTNELLGNPTSEEVRAGILDEVSGVRLGGTEEAEIITDLQNDALDRADIPAVQLSERERILGTASPEARWQRAGEVVLVGRDFRNPADYEDVAELRFSLDRFAKNAASQAQINQAVADFSSTVAGNAGSGRNNHDDAGNHAGNHAGNDAGNHAENASSNGAAGRVSDLAGATAGSSAASNAESSGSDAGSSGSDAGSSGSDAGSSGSDAAGSPASNAGGDDWGEWEDVDPNSRGGGNTPAADWEESGDDNADGTVTVVETPDGGFDLILTDENGDTIVSEHFSPNGDGSFSSEGGGQIG
ncbi:MAG: hypothetical protein GY903_04065, partial [Fuerstiella sp.]|nr:hypothetical protein [Fuerstiella sp.]